MGYLWVGKHVCSRCPPAALLVLPSELPNVPVCADSHQAALRLLWWPPFLQARSISLRFLQLMLECSHQSTSTSEEVCYQKLCCQRLHHFLGTMAQSTSPREEDHGICDGRCKAEIYLFASWVSVWRKNADWRAVNSQGSCFSKGRVICCSWPFASGREKRAISLSCDAAQEKLPKVRISIVYRDRCSCPLLCLPSHSCLILHLPKEESAPRDALTQVLLTVMLPFSCKSVPCFSKVEAVFAAGVQSFFMD